MGALRDQLFLQFVNKGLGSVRSAFRDKGTPKKDNRFWIKGITYDLGDCSLDESGQFVFEISSKIPHGTLPKKNGIERFFKAVVRIMSKAGKRPTGSKMENIIRNTTEAEFKERDYVKLLYSYSEQELYTHEDIAKRIKLHQTGNLPIPNIPGVATVAGKVVLALVGESIQKLAKTNITDLINANEEVKKSLISPPADKSTARKKPMTKKKVKK